VKEALDKLINVLQSPEQVRKLVIGSNTAANPKESSLRVSRNSKLSFKSLANTPPLSMKTKEKQTQIGFKGDVVDTIDAQPSSHNSIERKKMTTLSSGGNQTSKLECSVSPIQTTSQLESLAK